jgi:hypothetical protein
MLLIFFLLLLGLIVYLKAHLLLILTLAMMSVNMTDLLLLIANKLRAIYVTSTEKQTV